MKKYFQWAFLFLLGTILSINIISCSRSSDKKEQTNTTTGDSKPADVPATGNSGGWLSGMPGTIPPFTHGVFSTQSEKIDFPTQTMYSLYYEKVTMENARQYLAKLKEKGFKVEEDANVSPGDLSAIGSLGKGAGRIGYSFSLQSNGHVDLHFTIFKNAE
jgi:hypothetical protein